MHLGGHNIYVDSYDSHDHADLSALLQSTGVETYYALGDTWSVILGDVPTLQYQITNNASELLKQGFAHTSVATPNFDGEKTIAEAAVKALGGSVEHYKP